MADESTKGGVFITSPSGKRLYLRRSTTHGRFVTREGGEVAPDPGDNLVLRQLQSIRQELKVVMERQARQHELITRLAGRVDSGFEETRRDIRELRSDVVGLENKLLTNQNEILDIVRRLDEAEEEGFEIVEAEPEPNEVVSPDGG